MSHKSQHDIAYRLKRQLQHGLNHDTSILLEILKDLLRICQGKGMESRDVLNAVIKLTPIKDLRVKKLVYLYLSFVTDDDSDMWLQLVNSITNDLSEPNPVLQNAALLLTTDSLSLSSSVNETRLSFFENGLKDSNNSVRKCSVAGVLKFSELIKHRKIQLDMSTALDKLGKMIYEEEDPGIIVQCIHCLHRSHQETVWNKVLISLLDGVRTVNAWTAAEIMNLFVQVVDVSELTEDEIFHSLNCIDPYLDSKYPPYVSLVCSVAMIIVSSKVAAIFDDVKDRVFDFLLSQNALIPRYFEPVYFSALEALSLHCPYQKMFPHLKVFSPMFNDGDFVKAVKLRLLSRCCSEGNSSHIFRVVSAVMITSHKRELIGICSNCLINLYQFLPEECGSFIISLLDHDSEIVFDAILTVLWQLMYSGRYNPILNDSIVPRLIKRCPHLLSVDGRISYYSILVMFATVSHMNAISDIMLHELIKWDTHDSIACKLNLLRNVLCFYVASPSNFQVVKSRFLLKACNDTNPVVSKSAYTYSRLLNKDCDLLNAHLETILKLKHSATNPKSQPAVNIMNLKSLLLLCIENEGS